MNTKRLWTYTKLKEKTLKDLEHTVQQNPQLKFVVYPQVTHYDSLQKLCTRVSVFYFDNYLPINPDYSNYVHAIYHYKA